MSQDVRPSPLAGRWYPASPNALKAEVEAFLGEAPKPAANLRGLLAPHAGLRFSGGVAGAAFRHLFGRTFPTVVVVGPSHYPFPGRLLTTAHDAYETPLGRVPVALDAPKALSEKVDMTPLRDDPEHAIEIELPFLQVTLGEFQLLPLAILDQSLEAAQQLATALKEIFTDQNVLYAASSDLSHFYDQNTANHLDKQVTDAVSAYDPAAVIAAEHAKQGIACGRGAVATVMLACDGTVVNLERYATSGDVTGDFSRVVGYASATFYA